jgi:hypothetical protein
MTDTLVESAADATGEGGPNEAGADVVVADAEAGVSESGADASDTGITDTGVADATDGGACDPGAPDGGTNIVTDPGFENGEAIMAGPPMESTNLFFSGGGGTPVIASLAHCGSHSFESSNRTGAFNGPSYFLPTTAATYTVSLWAMQDGASTVNLELTQRVTCAADGGSAFAYTRIGTTAAPPNTWVKLTGTILYPPADCTGTGNVASAPRFYVEQDVAADAGPMFPNIYIDDVYVNQ